MTIRLILVLSALMANMPLKAAEIDVSLLGSFGLYSPWNSETDATSFDIQHRHGQALKIAAQNLQGNTMEVYFATSRVALSRGILPALNFDVKTLQLGTSSTYSQRNMNEYLGAGFGVTRFTPRDFSGHQADDLSISVFSGIQSELTDHLLLTFEGRLQWVILDSVTRIACSGGCIIQIKSEVWGQLQLQAGVTYRF